MEKKKIEIYAVRSFSDKMSATFSFVSENRKVLFRFLIYLFLPLGMVQALGMNRVMDFAALQAADVDTVDIIDSDIAAILSGYAVYALTSFIGSILCMTMVYGLMRLYNEREERLEGLTFGEFAPTLKGGLWRILKFVALITVSLVLLIAGMVLTVEATKGTVIGVIVLFATFASITLLLPPLAITPAICIFEEDITVTGAIAKAVRLGFRTWGGIFAMVSVLSMLCYFIVGAFSTPWYIMLIVKNVFIMSDSLDAGSVNSPVYTVITYLFGIIQALASYGASALLYIGIGIQYGHAAEKIDGVSVERDVDNFEQLADEEEELLSEEGRVKNEEFV